MKQLFKLITSCCILLIFTSLIYSQDNSDVKWNQNSPSTRAYIGGTYQSLPHVESYVKRDMTTKIYHTPQGDILVNPNIRPYPSTATQSEERLQTMTGNPNIMYGAWNSYYPSFYGTGFCFTSNGGTSWTGNYQMIVSGNNGDPGPWIWSSASTWPGRLGISVIGSAGISATYSTDNGNTWTAFYNAGGSSTDKNLSCVDDVPGSSFIGRAYTVWTDFGGSYVNRICGAYTSNGGVSWTGYGPVSPVPASGHHHQGCDCCVGPGGVLYVVWANCTTNGQNSTEDSLGFAKSTDGGVTYAVSRSNAVDVNGIRAQYFYNNFRVAGFPILAVDKSGGSRNGWIYATLCEKTVAPARDNGDVCLCRSTDGGTTWTHTLVNGDASGNYQWFSSICVDQTNGLVAIGYYDNRGLTAPNAQYYMSWSNNGGTNWTDVLVSDHTFVPTPISGLATGYQGDYTGISYSNGKFWPFWCDNSANPSSNLYQVWTVGVQALLLPHDIMTGPFLSFPSYFLSGSTYAIKAKATNVGTSTETSIPVKWLINNVLTNTNTIASLTVGQSDSVSNNWVVPAAVGTYNLKYISSLTTDTNRLNDTLQYNVTIAHDIAMTQFVNFPSGYLVINTPYNITGQTQNVGNFNETGVPISFYVNGTLVRTATKSLNGNQIDTANNVWTATTAGTYTLKYIAGLSTDLNHANDTLQTTVNVYTTAPAMCPFSCMAPMTYTAITGTAGPTGDDAGLTANIGFTFTYKGNSFTQAWICTNGYIIMGATGTIAYTNDLATTDATAVNMIAGFWDDLYVTTGGNIQYTTQGTAPNRIFIVQWTTVAFLASTSNNITFQIRLYEQPTSAGTVEIVYGPSTPYASATGSVGINVTPGGSGNFTSITPGSSGCSNTTYSTTTANNSLPSTNLTNGTHYIFCPMVGIHQEQNTVPSVFALSQNYPNPFNPSTSIKYSIPKTSMVKLTVYDVTGREVTTLVNETKQAGYYDIKFEGTNYASGVYFYKIEAGNFTEVKKMVLIK